MAVFYSDVANLQVNSTPRQMPAGNVVGGSVRRYRAVINLATVAGGAAVTTADQIVLAEIPAGSVFDFGILVSSVTLGTAVIAIGTGATHGTNGQYRAAATSTAVDAPALFGIASAASSAPLAANTLTYLTVATANLPTSGTVVVDLYYSQV